MLSSLWKKIILYESVFPNQGAGEPLDDVDVVQDISKHYTVRFWKPDLSRFWTPQECPVLKCPDFGHFTASLNHVYENKTSFKIAVDIFLKPGFLVLWL